MSEFIKKYWFTLPLVILVTLIYIWYVSAGTWIKWVSATHLYDDMARGFLKGNLYLPTKVNFKLLPIANPNDNSVGLKPSGPLDVSYFAGKYYIYWGPAPAILLLLIHTIISRIVGDLQLVGRLA